MPEYMNKVQANKESLSKEQKELVMLETEMHLNSLSKVYLKESKVSAWLRFYIKEEK